MNNFNDILRASCLFYQYLAHIGAKIVFGNLYYLENSKKFSAKIDPHPGDSRVQHATKRSTQTPHWKVEPRQGTTIYIRSH